MFLCQNLRARTRLLARRARSFVYFLISYSVGDFFFREIKTWLKVELIFVKIKPCRFFVLKPAKQDMILDRFLKKRSLKFLDKMTNIGGIKKMTGEEINQQFFFI